MSGEHILVVADTQEAGQYLTDYLLPGAGYQATLSQDFAPPPACNLVLVDISRLRFSPFAGLKAQRRMGCEEPALLIASRVTDQMARDIFALNVRAYVSKPFDEQQLLQEIQGLLERTSQESGQARMGQEIRRMRDILAHRLNELGTLSRIGRALASLTDVDTMLSYIVEAGVYLTRADEGAIFLADETTGQLQLRAEKGLEQRRAEAIRVPSSDSTAATVFQTGQPIIRGSDASPEERKVKTGFLVKALVNVPVTIGDQTIGVLAVYNHGVQQFTQSDQAVLSALADYAAIALDKAYTVNWLGSKVQALQQALKETAELALSVRDPVDAVEAQTYLLLEHRLGPLTPEQQDSVHRIRLATGRLKEIADWSQELGMEAE